jgi:small subunit ribosomal protein S25e
VAAVARQKGKGGQQRQKEARSTVQQAAYDVGLPEELVEKVKGDLRRERYLTPFKVAQRYDVSISTAKRILKALEKDGLLVRVGGTRRSPIFVPKGKELAFESLSVGVRAGERL